MAATKSKTIKAKKQASKAENSKAIENEFNSTIKAVRKEQQQKGNTPNWLYFTGKDKDHPHADAKKLGDYLYQKHKNEWQLVQDNDVLEFWTYDEKQGIWQLDTTKLLSGLVQEEMSKQGFYNDSEARYTRNYLNGLIQQNVKPKSETMDKVNPDLFNFKNGVLNLETMHVARHSPHDYFTNVTDYSIPTNDSKKPLLTEKWFAETFGDSAKALEQFIGYIFYPDYTKIQAYFLIIASGGNGKTTIINYIQSLVPSEEVSNLDLKAICMKPTNNKNFSLSELYHKRLNAYDDISSDLIPDTSYLKQVTGGGKINAPVKGKKDLQFAPYAKIIIAGNDLPNFKDTSAGMSRRPYVLHAHSIDGFNDKYDMKKIMAERGAFVRKCIKMFQTQYQSQVKQHVQNPRLYTNDEMRKATAKWMTDNDTVQLWINDCVIPEAELKDIPNKYRDPQNPKKAIRPVLDTYSSFANWCKGAGLLPMSRPNFNKALIAKGFAHDRVRRNGKRRDCWFQLLLWTDTGSIDEPVSNMPHIVE